MNVPHPIPYQGSKRNLAREILRHFPESTKRLVEPFAGSAAISLAAAAKGVAGEFWINDAHRPLVTLWRELLEAPERLSRDYEELWKAQIGSERAFYDEVRTTFNQTHSPSAFLYLLARCVKAAIRYNGNGEFNNSPDNRRKGARPSVMRGRILGASALLASRTRLTCLDYRGVLNECQPSDVIYMDPPYQGVSGKRDNRYAPTIDHEEFCTALSDLVRRKLQFLVSYDGRSGDRVYGSPLPSSLGLTLIELDAGPSSQATLLGRNSRTVESLYLSPELQKRHSARRPIPPVSFSGRAACEPRV